MGAYSVVMVEMSEGERMPLMCSASTGLGIFEPTAYALYLRSRGRAVNTVSQALRAVQLLYEILLAAGIDLCERAKANELLTLADVETIVEKCKLKIQDLHELQNGPREGSPTNLNIARLRKTKTKSVTLQTVDQNTAAVRLEYIKQYLIWFTEYAYLQNIPKDREEFSKIAERVTGAISTRTPSTRKKSSRGRRRGLTSQDEKDLLKLVSPDSLDNPWKNDFLRFRNYLIIRILLGLGIRKGELLGVKISDISLSQSKLFIARRADDPEDKRHIHPATKTYDRDLLVGDELMKDIKKYLSLRSKSSTAKKHPFFIVSENGHPLSLNSIDFLFSRIRESLPHIEKLSAHVLRHTWNDRFSEAIQGKLTPDEEKKVRNYLMGWSETSRSAENYTTRYVENQAQLALVDLQSKMFGVK